MPGLRRTTARAAALLLALLAVPGCSPGPRTEPVEPATHPEPAFAGHAELPGVRLWYSDTGGTGTPVVLLHPTTGTSETWTPQVEAFRDAGYRVIAVDRRGWGRSTADPATGPQPGDPATDLQGLVEHLELPPFHLVAIASGAFGGIDYSATHPDRVRSLVAAATTGGFDEPELRTFREHAAIPAIERPAPAVYREVSAGYRGSNPDGTQQWIERERSARQPGAPDQPVSAPNTYAKLGRITAPLLVVAGGADLISPPELMRTWARHAPPHEFAIIAESGHSLSYEQPDEFNRIVLEFLGVH